MSEIGPIRRGMAAFTAVTTLVANTGEVLHGPEPPVYTVVQSPSSPEDVELKNRNMVDPDSLPAGEATHIVIYPVSVEAKGFQSPDDRLSHIAGVYMDGWQRVRTALGQQPNSLTDILPTRKVRLPGIIKVPDFCDDDERIAFREKLIDAVLPLDMKAANSTPSPTPTKGGSEYDRVIPVIAVDQVESPKCVIADANKANEDRRGIIVDYNSRETTEDTAAHEEGHILGAGHDSRLEGCDAGVPLTTIDGLCSVNEYGSDYTVMGHGTSDVAADQDIFTGYAKLNMDRLDRSQVQEYDLRQFGEQRFRIHALENPDDVAKLVRIPLSGVGDKCEMPVVGTELVDKEKSKEKKKEPVFATAAYIELSGTSSPEGANEGKDQSLVSVKIYLVDETQELPDTRLLPVTLAPDYGIGPELAGKKVTFMIGDRFYTLGTYEITQEGNQHGSALLGVEVIPAKGAGC